MTRTNWTMIRDTLSQEIADGLLEPGERLPTEPQLAERFGVGRHSVRRAVDALARSGQVSVEQGRGTFVEAPQVLTYAIGKRTRLRRNLMPQGVDVGGELLGAERVVAKGRVRKALLLDKGALVIASRRLSLANDVPLSFGTSYHCAERFPEIDQRRDLMGSTTEAYRSYGIEDYVRAHTTIHARPSKPSEAKLLKQHPENPVLVVRAVDALPDGTPISYKQVIWAAARVSFTMGLDDD